MSQKDISLNDVTNLTSHRLFNKAFIDVRNTTDVCNLVDVRVQLINILKLNMS